MRTLLLLRHAKSNWDDPTQGDHDRPLAERGREAARRMGSTLGERGLDPDLVLCSTAVRAQETWLLAAPAAGSRAPVRDAESLYLADPARLLAVVRSTPDEVLRLLVVGHNPGLARFAAELVAKGPARDLKRMRRKFPTAALAVIAFNAGGWNEIAPGQGTLEAFIRPRDLP